MFVAAVFASEDVIPLSVNGGFNVVSVKILVAHVAEHVIAFNAMLADEGTVAGLDDLVNGAVFFAVFTKAVVIVEAMLADANTFAVAVDDFPRLRAAVFAFLAELVFFRVATVAVKSAGNLFAATDAQAVSPDAEGFEIVEMVFANGDFGVEVGVVPVGVTAEAFTLANVDVTLIVAVFLGNPEIGSVFEFGQFTLDKVAVKF